MIQHRPRRIPLQLGQLHGTLQSHFATLTPTLPATDEVFRGDRVPSALRPTVVVQTLCSTEVHAARPSEPCHGTLDACSALDQARLGKDRAARGLGVPATRWCMHHTRADVPSHEARSWNAIDGPGPPDGAGKVARNFPCHPSQPWDTDRGPSQRCRSQMRARPV